MKTFSEWLNEVDDTAFQHYYGNQDGGAATATTHLIGKVIKVLQHQTNNLNTVLSHHNEILGHKADPYAGHKKFGNLHNIDGANGSESVAVKQVTSGYNLLGQFLPNLESAAATEKDRDLKLYAQDLIKAIREGEQMSAYFTKGMGEREFAVLQMNHQKLIRLVHEGLNFMGKKNPKFGDNFSATQQHTDIGDQNWRKKDAVSFR